MKTEIYTCDIQGCTNEASVIDTSYQVITKEREMSGRIIKPKLIIEKLDLCKDHAEQVIESKKYLESDYNDNEEIVYYTT